MGSYKNQHKYFADAAKKFHKSESFRLFEGQTRDFPCAQDVEYIFSRSKIEQVVKPKRGGIFGHGI